MHLRSVSFHPEKFPTQEHFPFNLSIFHETKSLPFDNPVTLFVGENGTGKSTLIEALAYKCGIHIWQSQKTKRYQNNPYEQRFADYISIQWANGRVPGSFFGSSTFLDFSRMLDEWAATDPGQLKYFGGKSLMTQSHGQSMMSYFNTRYAIEGLYLMDEPETALSPKTQLGLIEVLKDMSADGHAQFIIATHSPILLACPGATIYSFDHIPILSIAYEETGHYKIYKDFMADPDTYLSAGKNRTD